MNMALWEFEYRFFDSIRSTVHTHPIGSRSRSQVQVPSSLTDQSEWVDIQLTGTVYRFVHKVINISNKTSPWLHTFCWIIQWNYDMPYVAVALTEADQYQSWCTFWSYSYWAPYCDYRFKSICKFHIQHLPMTTKQSQPSWSLSMLQSSLDMVGSWNHLTFNWLRTFLLIHD